VLRLQPIYRNHNVQMAQSRPTGRERTEGAGNYLHVDSSVQQLWNQGLQFAIPN
jgi:hypothetical protein